MIYPCKHIRLLGRLRDDLSRRAGIRVFTCDKPRSVPQVAINVVRKDRRLKKEKKAKEDGPDHDHTKAKTHPADLLEVGQDGEERHYTHDRLDGKQKIEVGKPAKRRKIKGENGR